MQKYVVNLASLGNGSALQRLIEADMDPAVLRPWRAKNGRSYITVNTGEYDKDDKPIMRNIMVNTPALLRREDWLMVDRAVMWQAKQILRLWNDIYAANPVNIPNGMGEIAIQHTVADGDADAILSMDPVRKSERRRPTLDNVQIPLPVVHSDGSFTAREIAVSRKSGMQLDTQGIRLSVRKCGEVIESLCLGVTGTSYTYQGVGTIYGLTNFPQRFTKSMTLPTAGGWTPKTFITEILDMIKTLKDNLFYGPYVLYLSNAWVPYFENDYSITYAGDTLRLRVEKIADISGVRTLEFFGTTAYKAVLVQMTADVIEAIQGMPLTTVQWEEQGGMEAMFKVLGIQLPRVRANFNGKTGIVDGTGA